MHATLHSWADAVLVSCQAGTSQLSTTKQPFVCLFYSNQQLKEEIALLRTKVSNAHSLQANSANVVEALRTEVAQLKEAILSVFSELASLCASKTTDEPTYASRGADQKPAQTVDSDSNRDSTARNNAMIQGQI